MAVKAAGSAQQLISWRSAPTLSARTGDVGLPGATTSGWNLRDFVKNPVHKTLTFALVAGYSYPSGWSGTSAGAVNWNGSATPVTRTPFKWRVTQQNPAYSIDSPEGWVESLAPVVQTPVAPTVVTATANSVSQITVAWTAGSGGSTPVKYRVYESLVNGPPWTMLDEPTASPYVRTELPTSAQRWYYVSAVDANDAESQPSLAASATTFDDPIPHVVQNFAVTLFDADTIRVSWTAPAGGPTPTGYKVYRASSGGGVFAVLAANHPASPYDHDGLDPATSHYYKVAAMNGANEGPPSPILFATTPPVIVPAMPINPTATATSSTAIALTWQPGEGGSEVTEFRVYRTTTPGVYSGTPIGTVSAAQALASDDFNRANNADLGADWDPAVRAFAIASNTAKATAVPTSDAWETNNTVAWPADQFSQITVAATGATISAGVGPAVRVSGAVPPIKTMYRLIANGGGWQLRKSVHNTSIETLATAATPTFTASDVVRLSVAGTATAVLRCSKNGVEFATHSDSVTPLTTGKAGIFYQATDATAAIQSWSGGGNFSLNSTGLAESTRYYYTVRAYDGTSLSPVSVEVSAVTHTIPPATPTIMSVLSAPAPNAQTTLRVTWQAGVGANTSPTTYYQLHRSDTPTGTFTQVAGSGNITATSYDDSPPFTAGQTRSYKVKAFDAQDDASGFSNVGTGTTASSAVPGIPATVAAAAISADAIRVSWTQGGGSTPTGYKIYRDTNSGGAFTTVAGTDTASPFDNSGLAPATTYHYKVSALDSAQSYESNKSLTASATTQPEQPPATGFPDASNTGVPSGTTLTNSASITSSANGQIIENKNISGKVTINHDNVTLRKCRVTATSTTDRVVQVASGAANALIEDCELIGAGMSGASGVEIVYALGGVGVGEGITVRRCDISNGENGIVPASYATIEDNWIHNLKGPGEPHYDGVAMSGGQVGVVVSHNHIDMSELTQTNPVRCVANFASISNITVDDNLLKGGGFCIEAHIKSGTTNQMSGVVITNNRCAPRTAGGSGGYLYPTYNIATWSGNVRHSDDYPLPIPPIPWNNLPPG